MTATPRKPRITFPENPVDGQQVTEIIDDLSCVIWTYEAETNSWKYQIYGLPQDVIYTDQVRVRGTDVAPMKEDDGEIFLQTQRDINHYLDAKAPDLEGVVNEDWVNQQGFATEEWVNAKGYATQSWTQEEIGKIPATDLSGHVTKEEFTQSQAEQDLEISKLDAKVDQIQGKAGQGKWTYDGVNINPRPGDFIMMAEGGIATSQWNQAVVIKFSEQDAVGHNYNFHRAVEGDVIKVAYELGAEVSFAEFQVTPGGNGTFGVTRLLGNEGYARADWRYDVEHFSSFDPAGVATQDYVDEGDQGVKDYVDERIAAIPDADPVPLDDYLLKSGDTMPGNLTCEGYLTVKGPVSRLYFKEEDGDNKMTVYPSGLIETAGEIRVDKSTGQLFTGKQNGTSKFRVYADGTVETEKSTPPNAKALTTKGWVDDQIKSVQVPGYVWKCANHQTAENLTRGEFFVSSSNNLYLHPISHCGRDLSVASDVNYETINILISVFTSTGSSKFSMCANEVKFNNRDNNYIRVQKRNLYYKGSLSSGTVYHLSIPGFSS